MNERIRKLAEQAAKWAQQAQWSTDPRFGDRPFSDLYDEKFAELMVRDCAEFVQFYYKDHRHVCEVIAYDMKQHFGVEE